MPRFCAVALLVALVHEAAYAQVVSTPPAAAETHPSAGEYPLAPLEPSTLTPRRSVHWANSTALGASLGLGAPFGSFGAFVTHNITRGLQLEAGGGYSMAFGASVGFMARLGLDPGNDSLAAIGLGVSANFSPFHYPTNCTYANNTVGVEVQTCNPAGGPQYADGTAYPIWLNLEASEDLRALGDYGARAGVGASVLLNPEGFPLAAGCSEDTVGHVPCNVGADRSVGRVFFQFYVHLDVYFLLYNGLESGHGLVRLPTTVSTQPDAGR